MGYWTSETVERLKELHALKLSASGIAAEMPKDRLGKPPTRNAIIGKLQRLGLVYEGPEKARYRPRVKVEKPPKSERAVKAPKPKSALSIRLPEEPAWSHETPARAPHGSEAILGLRHGACCFPIGDPRADDFRYCCAPSGGKQYCAHHMQIAYVPSKPRKASRKPDAWHAKGQSAAAGRMTAVFDRAAHSKPLLDAAYGGESKGRGFVYDGV